MTRRIARLFEDVDDETPLEVVQVGGGSGLRDTWYLGTFSGHLDHDDEVIEDVPLDVALAWARERAHVIVIRVGEAHYGIGTPDGELPELPDDLAAWLVRRRPER